MVLQAEALVQAEDVLSNLDFCGSCGPDTWRPVVAFSAIAVADLIHAGNRSELGDSS